MYTLNGKEDIILSLVNKGMMIINLERKDIRMDSNKIEDLNWGNHLKMKKNGVVIGF